MRRFAGISTFLRLPHVTDLAGVDVAPIALGGDHGVLLAELRAAAQRYGPLALIEFDSHPDTWDQYLGQRYAHGTVVRRAVEEGLIDPSRSTQLGLRVGLYAPMTTTRRATWASP